MQWLLFNVLYSVTWVEDIQVFLALISWLSGQETMLAQVVLHKVPDVWLCSEFLGGEVADTVQNF